MNFYPAATDTGLITHLDRVWIGATLMVMAITFYDRRISLLIGSSQWEVPLVGKLNWSILHTATLCCHSAATLMINEDK